MKPQSMLQTVRDSLNAQKGDWRAIAIESGVPYSTLCKIAQGHIKNPGVNGVQMLYDHFLQKQAA